MKLFCKCFFQSALISTLDSGSEQLIEGTFSTLQKICEDIPDQLESESIQHPLIHLIPKFIEFFKCSSSKIRLHSITCINQFILCRSSALLHNIGLFLEGLFFLSEDKVSYFTFSDICIILYIFTVRQKFGNTYCALCTELTFIIAFAT